ncbi:hypothetical protein BDN67DRAFT_1072336 [Paxillus ammoniavirescens]|nr:hypothetical protein BDN67DRAFT_1072336 [Paxillus ammoniavirescens]
MLPQPDTKMKSPCLHPSPNPSSMMQTLQPSQRCPGGVPSITGSQPQTNEGELAQQQPAYPRLGPAPLGAGAAHPGNLFHQVGTGGHPNEHQGLLLSSGHALSRPMHDTQDASMNQPMNSTGELGAQNYPYLHHHGNTQTPHSALGIIPPHGAQYHAGHAAATCPPYLYNESNPCAQSVGARGSTLMDDYQSIYSASSHSSNQMNPYHHRSSSSFDCDPSLDSPLGLNAMVTCVLAEVRSLHSKMGKQEEVINELRSASDSLASELKANRDAIEAIQKQNLTSSMAKKKAKGGSNDHPALKPIIHPLFCDFCGIDWATAKKKRVRILALNVKKLEDNTPFEIVEGGRKIWHPDWLGKVDDDLNAQFIHELAQRVWNNEETLRANPSTKGELPDADFDMEVITESVKCYFRTIHSQTKAYQNPTKAKEADDRLVTIRQRAHHATVAKARRLVADKYKTESGNIGAVAMIDSEFGTDILSYTSGELSEDMLDRRKEADVGKTANMAVGHAWRSIDYVAYLRWLSLRSMKKEEEDEGVTTKTTMEPQKKRCKPQTNEGELAQQQPAYPRLGPAPLGAGAAHPGNLFHQVGTGGHPNEHQGLLLSSGHALSRPMHDTQDASMNQPMNSTGELGAQNYPYLHHHGNTQTPHSALGIIPPHGAQYHAGHAAATRPPYLYNESNPRAQSVGARGSTPMDDYQSIYSASSRSSNQMNPYHHRSSSSFDCDPSLDSPLGLNAMVTCVLAEVRSLHSKMGKQEEVINELRSASDSLASELKAN